MSTLLHLLLVPVLLPFSLAYRDGARSESCYGHEIEHISSNPMVGRLVRQDCLPPCNFDLILDGRVDAVSRAIEEDMVNDTLECGESYQCTYVSMYFLFYQLRMYVVFKMLWFLKDDSTYSTFYQCSYRTCAVRSPQKPFRSDSGLYLRAFFAATCIHTYICI